MGSMLMAFLGLKSELFSISKESKTHPPTSKDPWGRDRNTNLN